MMDHVYTYINSEPILTTQHDTYDACNGWLVQRHLPEIRKDWCCVISIAM